MTRKATRSMARLAKRVCGAAISRTGTYAESQTAHGHHGPKSAMRNACFQGDFERMARI